MGPKCDCKIDWLWVRSPLEEMKYSFKLIFPFLRSGVEDKCGVEFRHSTRNAPSIRRKLGNVSYFSAYFDVCGIQCDTVDIVTQYGTGFFCIFLYSLCEMPDICKFKFANEALGIIINIYIM